MMPIHELVHLFDGLDAAYRCPLGDEAAALWGHDGAVFVRSSANHVFLTTSKDDQRSVVEPVNTPRLVLRMRPLDLPGSRAALRRTATLAACLKANGAPVSESVPSVMGHLVERVGGYAIMACIAIEGDQVESDDCDADMAYDWGRLLAEFHAASGKHAPAVGPSPPGSGPPQDVDLPRSPDVYGLVHGDPELDNVVWTSEGGVLVDLDDVGPGWYAADIAFALRDWAPPADGPDLNHAVPQAFLAGYRSRRDLSEAEVAALPGLATAAARRTLAGLDAILSAPPDPHWPSWATELDARLRARADELRHALAANG